MITRIAKVQVLVFLVVSLLGVTYEVVGPPSAPILRVNPISAVAPGLLRKFFEFPSGNGPTAPQSYAAPAR